MAGRIRFLARNSRATVKATFDLKKAGFGDEDFKGAMSRAQIKNAEVALREVRFKAEREVKPRHPNKTRNRRHSDRMADRYEVLVDPDGDIHLSNPLLRARLFELGSPPHRIEAGQAPGRSATRRGYRGAFIKSDKTLRFWDELRGVWVRRYSVNHPGQRPNPIMQETIDENVNVFANNILDALEEEF